MLHLLSERFFLPIDLSLHFGFDMLFAFVYMSQLFTTVILLLTRIFLVAVGMILFPIGIFMYFIQPLKEYGKSIIYFFASMIFVPFILTIVFIVYDQIVMLPFFDELKPLVLVSMLSITNLVLLYALFGALLKAFAGSTSLIQQTASTVRAVKYLL